MHPLSLISYRIIIFMDICLYLIFNAAPFHRLLLIVDVYDLRLKIFVDFYAKRKQKQNQKKKTFETFVLQ